MSTESEANAQVPTRNFLRVLKTDSFVEKALLLVLTAVLSGVFIPLIIRSVDHAREGREAVANAQAKLFDDISETILTIETLILDVIWFGTKDAKNVDMQKKAFERYTERSVDLISKWRAQSSRAQSLVSKDFAKKLDDFQIKFFREQDKPMNNLWMECSTNCDWAVRHQKNEAMLGEANMLILELANDLNLIRQ